MPGISAVSPTDQGHHSSTSFTTTLWNIHHDLSCKNIHRQSAHSKECRKNKGSQPLASKSNVCPTLMATKSESDRVVAPCQMYEKTTKRNWDHPVRYRTPTKRGSRLKRLGTFKQRPLQSHQMLLITPSRMVLPAKGLIRFITKRRPSASYQHRRAVVKGDWGCASNENTPSRPKVNCHTDKHQPSVRKQCVEQC